MPHIPRAFCAHCDKEMFCDEIGKVVETLTKNGPYYKVSCDKYSCRGCGSSVLIYHDSTSPIHHHQQDYDQMPVDHRCTFLP